MDLVLNFDIRYTIRICIRSLKGGYEYGISIIHFESAPFRPLPRLQGGKIFIFYKNTEVLYKGST